jgi:formylglycine-generating enzyme required for sulfatase activity
MRAWIRDAEDLVARIPDHEKTRTRLFQRVLLQQVRDLTVTSDRTNPDWSQAAPGLSWRHSALISLLADERRVEREISEVRRRLREAESIQDRSIDSNRSKWEETVAGIEASAVYGGLTIKPQLGLVPLAENATTGLWEFWAVQTGSSPEDAMLMVLVPGGTFEMGADEGPSSPRHKVELRPFFIGKCTLTMTQLDHVMGTAGTFVFPSQQRVDDKGRVSELDWPRADEIAYSLGMSLPTEAQWEYVSTAAGKDTISHASPDSSHSGEGLLWNRKSGNQFPMHIAVASAEVPNAWGVEGLLDDLWEWCMDRYVGYDHPAEMGTGLRGRMPIRNRNLVYTDTRLIELGRLPYARAPNELLGPQLVVVRGGNLRVSTQTVEDPRLRLWAYAATRSPNLGIRLARQVDE